MCKTGRMPPIRSHYPGNDSQNTVCKTGTRREGAKKTQMHDIFDFNLSSNCISK